MQNQIAHLRQIASFLLPNENDQEVLLKRLIATPGVVAPVHMKQAPTAPMVDPKTVAHFLIPNDRDQMALFSTLAKDMSMENVGEMMDARTSSTETEDAVRRKYGSHGPRTLSSQESRQSSDSKTLESFLAKL